MATYAEEWRASVARNREFFQTPPEPFENWAGNHMAWSSAEFYLGEALEALYAQEPTLSTPFLTAAVQQADRAIKERKFSSPCDQGQLWRVGCYARWLLGASLSLQDLGRAAAAFEDFLGSQDQEEWRGTMVQAFCLGYVRMLLIAGQAAKAGSVIRERLNNLNWHERQARLLSRVADFSAGLEPKDGLEGEVRVFFDAIRGPEYKRKGVFEEQVIQRLEWGIMLSCHFGKCTNVDPSGVIALIRE